MREKSGITHIHGFNIGTHSTSWHFSLHGYIQKYVGAGRYYLLTETHGLPIGSKSITYNPEVNQLAIPLIANIGLDVALLYLIESNDKKAFQASISRKEILNISKEDATKLYDSWIKVLDPYVVAGEKPVWHERECNIVLPMIARLCIWLDPKRVLNIIHLIWKIYGLCDNDAELLSTCYNSLPIDQAIEAWWEVMRLPISLDDGKQDIIKPNVHIQEWRGNKSTVDFIIAGLSNDSFDIRSAAMDRFCDIHLILPQKYQDEVDNAIFANFDKLLNFELISILGVVLQNGDERVWKDKFRAHLQERIVNFIESDISISRSSTPISTFDDFIITFIDCYRHLTQEQVNKILKKILDFLTDNYETLRDTNDSESLFGGLKRFLDQAMNHVNIFIAHIDASSLQNEIRNDLLKKFKLLSSSYPLIRTIVHLSFIGKSVDTSESVKDNKEFIKYSLEKDVISSDYNRMRDAFYAAAESQQLTKGNFSIQEIVKSAIDHIRDHLDSETYYILLLLPLWIAPNIIMKKNLGILFNILAELPQRISNAKDITAELKSDMLYYGGQLAGQISKTEFDDVDKTNCIESWQTFANSTSFPNDIRNGFFKGQK